MLPGPDEILRCTHCSALVTRTTWASGNTFGAVRWSDGYLAAPMLQRTFGAALCSNCDGLLWLEDCESIGEIAPAWSSSRLFREDCENALEPEVPAAWRAAPDLKPLAPKDFRRALESIVNQEPHRRLSFLIFAWHKLNDFRRTEESTGIPKEYAQLFERVCEKLLACFGNRIGEERLLVAELLRELGRFNEAADVLTQAQGPVDDIGHLMLDRCLLKDSGLFRLSSGTAPLHH